jgi:hypothetical protein
LTESTDATAAKCSVIDRKGEWNVELGRLMMGTWAQLDEDLGEDEIEGLELSTTIEDERERKATKFKLETESMGKSYMLSIDLL